MNLKIDRALPCPPSSHPGLTLTYLPLLDSVMLYVHVSTTEEKLEEPKKKFTFKVDKQTAIADIFWLYSVPKRCWTSQETKGKIPSRRERMVTIFL